MDVINGKQAINTIHPIAPFFLQKLEISSQKRKGQETKGEAEGRETRRITLYSEEKHAH
jgi:hypothetical protein